MYFTIRFYNNCGRQQRQPGDEVELIVLYGSPRPGYYDVGAFLQATSTLLAGRPTCTLPATAAGQDRL